MPRYTTEVTHSLGKEEALARLKALTERARNYSDLKGTWTDSTFEFSVSAQGVGISGTLQVESDLLKLDGKLPILAMPFAGWIPRVLKKGLEQEPKILNGARMSAADQTVANTSSSAPSAPAVLFLHIPKAAGQTLGEYVYNQCCADEACEDDLLKAGVAYLNYGFIKEAGLYVPEHTRSLLGRSDLRAVIGHFWFGLHQDVARPSTYITILRNPIDRIVSLYYYAKIHETMSLDEFIAHPPFNEVDNDQTRRVAGADPPLGGCTRDLLDQAKENLRSHFAVVGTTERFDETLVLLKCRLGWTREIVSYPRNVTAGRPASASLPLATVEAIRLRNELDFELWQFASQLMDEMIETDSEAFRGELEGYAALRSNQK